MALRSTPAGKSEDLDRAGIGPQQSGEDLDGGGLSRSVAAEKAKDAAGWNAQIQAVERGLAMERLAQSGRFDDWIIHRHSPWL